MKVAAFKSRLRVASDLLDEMQIVHHFPFPVAGAGILIAENFCGGACKTGEEQEQIVFQVMQSFGGNL